MQINQHSVPNLQMLGQDMLNESKNAQIDAENGQKSIKT
jgi:hypothetical protein